MQRPETNVDPEPRNRTAALSVLVVDDFRDGADSLADLLDVYGLRVQTAYDPTTALAAAPSDVVILELRLPEMTGWELVRRLRTRNADPRPLFIAVTTCGMEKDRLRSAEAGIDLHLVKPVEPSVLIGEMQRLTRGRQADMFGTA